MHRYILKRLVQLIPVILGVVLIIFLIMDLTPGDPARMVLGNMASEEAIAAFREEQGLNDPLPLEGSQSSFREKEMIRIRPSQNAGMAIPSSAATMPTVSNREFCLRAETIPIGTEITSAKMMLAEASCIVAGKRARSSSITGRLER